MKPWSKEKVEAFKQLAKTATIANFSKKEKINQTDIDDMVKYILPVKLSTKKICNCEDHVSQYDYFSDVMLNDYQTVITWANRAGSKTYLLSIINWLNAIRNKNLESVILGASKEQSLRAYDATEAVWKIGHSKYMSRPLIGYFCEKEPLKERTEFNNESELIILAASQKSARGPHPQMINLDEIDEMDKDILEAALSQPQRKHGIPMKKMIYSTNHVSGGNMDIQIERAMNNPRARIFKWCIWECLEACNGNCNDCDLFSICPGEQMKTATGYYAIEDFIDKLYSMSKFSLDTEWLNLKPGHPDMIYKNELTDNHFIDISYDPTRLVYLSIDWGGSLPFSVGAWQDFRNTHLKAWVRIDEIYQGDTSNNRIIAEVKKRPWANMIVEGIYDPESSSNARDWRSSIKSAKTGGELQMTPADNRVQSGIDAVRGALSPILGRPAILFSKKCKDLRREIFGYKCNPKTGEPIKQNDHACDDVRYFVAKMLKKAKSQSGAVA